MLQATQIEALKRTVREYERQLQQCKLAAEEERKRVEADRLFASKQVVVAMMILLIAVISVISIIIAATIKSNRNFPHICSLITRPPS